MPGPIPGPPPGPGPLPYTHAIKNWLDGLFATPLSKMYRMNVNPGGSQPKMRNTMWNGSAQTMVHNGVPKKVLEERGVNIMGMKAEDMRKVLKNMHDFKYEKTKVEKFITDQGYRCIFYHCELNSIERVWGNAKQYTRKYCDYSFQGLEHTIGPTLHSVSTDLIRKYYKCVCEYARAYREGHKVGSDMEKHSKNINRIAVYRNWIRRATAHNS